MTTIARLRGVFFIGISLIFLLGCLVPEQFDANLKIKKDGTFTFKYDGILTHALIRQALLAGGVDNKNDPDIVKLEKEFLEDPRFKKASYIGNGQFKVLAEVAGRLDEPFYFLSKDLLILAITPTSADEVEVSSFTVSEKSQEELAALKINVNGKLDITTDAKVLAHNAKAVGLLGTYSWQIASPKDPAPSMKLRLSRGLASNKAGVWRPLPATKLHDEMLVLTIFVKLMEQKNSGRLKNESRPAHHQLFLRLTNT